MNPTNTTPHRQEPEPRQGDVRVDGFSQVLEMLKIADPQFRDSLLKRLAARDPEMARRLRADLQD